MCYFVFLLFASIIYKPTREVASELQTYFQSSTAFLPPKISCFAFRRERSTTGDKVCTSQATRGKKTSLCSKTFNHFWFYFCCTYHVLRSKLESRKPQELSAYIG